MNNSNDRSSGRQRKYFQSTNHSILNETNRTNNTNKKNKTKSKKTKNKKNNTSHKK